MEWAAWVDEAMYDDHDEVVYVSRRLVIVEADSADEARREAGLPDASFAPPTADEQEAWDERVDEPLTEVEVERLERMVRAEAVELYNRRMRDRKRGRGESELRSQRNVGKAIRLATLRGKLASWAGALREDREEA